MKLLVGIAVALTICFSRPLLSLVCYAWHSELYSYILLVPFVSLYLVWSNRRKLTVDCSSSWSLVLATGLLGVTVLVGYWIATRSGWKPATEEYLALTTVAFLLFLASAALLCLGLGVVRRASFPIAFLLFIVPLPDSILQPIVTFLQHRSADVAAGLFWLSGTPFLRQETVFQLPGMPLQVAPECSGIHSTLVLFITSLVAGCLLLRDYWRRVILSAFVIPLALLRNGFRVFVIGQLCVHVGPDMINSSVHHRGGPLFFALSLIPFFLLLLWLRKTERKKVSSAGKLPLGSDSSGQI